MDNEAPIFDETKDKLGFMPIACQLASALVQNDLSGGFVIGVEGPWGSGKSSLVNYCIREIGEGERGTSCNKVFSMDCRQSG